MLRKTKRIISAPLTTKHGVGGVVIWAYFTAREAGYFAVINIIIYSFI